MTADEILPYPRLLWTFPHLNVIVYFLAVYDIIFNTAP